MKEKYTAWQVFTHCREHSDREHIRKEQASSLLRRVGRVVTVRLLCLIILLMIGVVISTMIMPAAAQAQTTSGELFSQHCAACHANGGNIIRRGKTLKQKALKRNGYEDAEAIISLVNEGKGSMPAFSDRLTAEEIEAIAHYVQTQAASNWKG